MVTAGRKRQREEDLSPQSQAKQAHASHGRSRESMPAQSAPTAQMRNRKGADELIRGSQGGRQAKEAVGKPRTPPAGGPSGAQHCDPDATRAVRAAALAVAASAVSRGGLALSAARLAAPNLSPWCSTALRAGLGVCHMLSSRDAAAAPGVNQTLKQPAALIAAAAKERQGRAEGSRPGGQAGVRTSRSGSITAGPGSQQGSTQSVESQATGLAMPGDPATGTAKQPLAAVKQIAGKQGAEGQEAGEHGAVEQPAGPSLLHVLSRPGKSPADQPASARVLGPTRHGPSMPGPVQPGTAGPATGSGKEGVTRQVLTQPDPVQGSAASQGSGTQCETPGKPGGSKLGICRLGSTVQGPSTQGNGKPDTGGRRTDTSKLGGAGPVAGTGSLGASKPPRHAANGVRRGHRGGPDGGAARAAAPKPAAADAAAGQPPPKPVAEAVAARQPARKSAAPEEVAAGQHPSQLHAVTVAMVAMVARLTATAAAAEGGAASGESDRDAEGSPSLNHQGPPLWRRRLSRQETAAAEPASVDRSSHCLPASDLGQQMPLPVQRCAGSGTRMQTPQSQLQTHRDLSMSPEEEVWCWQPIPQAHRRLAAARRPQQAGRLAGKRAPTVDVHRASEGHAAGWEQPQKEAGRQEATGQLAAGPCLSSAAEMPQAALSQQQHGPDAGGAAPAQTLGASTDSCQGRDVSAREQCPLQGWGPSNPLATAGRAPPAQPEADPSALSAWPACQAAQLAGGPGRQGLAGRGSTAAPAQPSPSQDTAARSWDTQLPLRQARQQQGPAGAQGQDSGPRSHLLQGGACTLEEPIGCGSPASSRGGSGPAPQGQPFVAQKRLQPRKGAQAGVQQQAWQQLLPQIRTSSRGPGSGLGQQAGRESPLQLPTPCQAAEPPAAMLDAALDRTAHPQPLYPGQQPPPPWQSFPPDSSAGRAQAGKVKGRRAGASSSGIAAGSSSDSDSGTTRARLVKGLVSSTRWPRMEGPTPALLCATLRAKAKAGLLPASPQAAPAHQEAGSPEPDAAVEVAAALPRRRLRALANLLELGAPGKRMEGADELEVAAAQLGGGSGGASRPLVVLGRRAGQQSAHPAEHEEQAAPQQGPAGRAAAPPLHPNREIAARLALAKARDEAATKRCPQEQGGYLGVRRRPWGTWVAEITVAGTCRLVGTFGSAKVAAQAYDAQAKQLWGSTAQVNFTGQPFAIKSAPTVPSDQPPSIAASGAPGRSSSQGATWLSDSSEEPKTSASLGAGSESEVSDGDVRGSRRTAAVAGDQPLVSRRTAALAEDQPLVGRGTAALVKEQPLGLKRRRPLRTALQAPPAKRRRGRLASAPKGAGAVRAAAGPATATAPLRRPSSAIPQVLREAAAVDARQQLKAAAGLGSSREVFTGRLQAHPWTTTWRDGRFAPRPELVALRPHVAAEAEAEAWPPIAMAGKGGRQPACTPVKSAPGFRPAMPAAPVKARPAQVSSQVAAAMGSVAMPGFVASPSSCMAGPTGHVMRCAVVTPEHRTNTAATACTASPWLPQLHPPAAWRAGNTLQQNQPSRRKQATPRSLRAALHASEPCWISFEDSDPLRPLSISGSNCPEPCNCAWCQRWRPCATTV